MHNKMLYTVVLSLVTTSIIFSSHQKNSYNMDSNVKLAQMLYPSAVAHNSQQQAVCPPLGKMKKNNDAYLVTAQTSNLKNRPATAGVIGGHKSVNRPSSAGKTLPQVNTNNNVGLVSPKKLTNFERELNDDVHDQQVYNMLSTRVGRNTNFRLENSCEQVREASIPRKKQQLKKVKDDVSQNQRARLPLCENKAKQGALLKQAEIESLAAVQDDKQKDIGFDIKNLKSFDDLVEYINSINESHKEVVAQQKEYDQHYALLQKEINTLKKNVGRLRSVAPMSLSSDEFAQVSRLNAMLKSNEESKLVLTVDLQIFKHEKLKQIFNQRKFQLSVSDLQKYVEDKWIHAFIYMQLKVQGKIV